MGIIHERHNDVSFTILGKETLMNEIFGDYVTCCRICGAKIEQNECYDFDDMIVMCHQCRNSPNAPNILTTSIQRFLIGNVV
jgi:hypothetical protein